MPSVLSFLAEIYMRKILNLILYNSIYNINIIYSLEYGDMALSQKHINSVFKTLDLDTVEKREKFLQWFKQENQNCAALRIQEQHQKQQNNQNRGKDAELEQSSR